MNTKSIFIGALALCLIFAPAGLAAKPTMEAFYPEALDPFTGNYVGRWDDEEKEDTNPDVCVQVYSLGRDMYNVRITTKLDMRCPVWCEAEVKAEEGVLSFKEGKYEVVIDGETAKISRNRGSATATVPKVVLESPMLGKAPLEGAEVLFDGSSLDAWDGTEGWEILPDGTLLVTPDGSYLSSKKKYTDVQLHVEFRLPYMPRAKGQSRGNSGVFLQESFEVQVLDSFGMDGLFNECGALYKLAAPKVNACRPPLQWQSYDIEYHAPRFNADGSVKTLGRITVLQNGVYIHKDQELPYVTEYKESGRLAPLPKEPGSIKLQGHNNYVQFRNVWVKALD